MLVVLMLAVSLVGIVWCVLLLRRARDWQMSVLTIMMGLVPVYQTVALMTEMGVLQSSMATQIRAFVDLIINLLFLIAVFLLQFAMEKKHSAEVRLRVLEQPLTTERPPTALPNKLRYYATKPPVTHPEKAG